MSDFDRPSQQPEPEPDGSVLGNLPRARPSVRSPRREQPRIEQAEAAASGPESPGAAGSGPEAEIEALARAGLALAGGAAALGFRLAGRTAAALRGAIERR